MTTAAGSLCRVADRLAALLLACVSLLGLACAHLGGGPEPLLQQAQQEMLRTQPEAAFANLRLIEERYPDSPENREAFLLAAQCFKVLYAPARNQDPSSRWVTTEKEFMFRWLARFYDGTFPEQETNTLLAGASYDLYREFVEFARTDPKLSRWSFRAEDDNGFTYAVEATRLGAAAQ